MTHKVSILLREERTNLWYESTLLLKSQPWGCPYLWVLTALHQSLSKYLTAQDTRGTPTITKHNRTLARLGNLLYIQPRSTIKVNRAFSVPCI